MLNLRAAQILRDWNLPASTRRSLSDTELSDLESLSDDELLDVIDRVRHAERRLRGLREQLESRWTTVRVCPVCAGDVVGRVGKVYCSSAHKQSAYLARKGLKPQNSG